MNAANLVARVSARRIGSSISRHTCSVRVFQPVRITIGRLLWVAVLAVVLASCGGGARPTLSAAPADQQATGDTETPTQTPATAAAATPQASPTEAGADSVSGGDSSSGSDTAGTDPATGDAGTTVVVPFVAEVLETFPHDATAFTQGLEFHDGMLIESTGLYGESDLRRVDALTGQVTQQVPIDARYFAEGVTRVGDQLIQLTWQENTAFYWDAATLAPIKEVSYQGEGWGICYDGEQLIMTDGTPTLIFRDPESFEETSRIAVSWNDQPLSRLNEVECVDGVVWANVWQTDLIVRIDPTSGLVTGVVDTTQVVGPGEPSGAVLNGIAWHEESASFYVTGKLWPTMYRVQFVPDS